MKNRPVSFNDSHICPTTEVVEAHLAEAHRLRNAELARLSDMLWHAPGALLLRIAARTVTGVGRPGPSRSKTA